MPDSGGGGTSIQLDAAGNPVVSHYNFANGDLKIVHCGDPNCTTENSIASPDTVGDVGQYTSLALDAAGNPVVSYYDETNGDLKVLHCGNPTCTAGNTIATPDTAGNVGQWTSLALNAAGHPVVSYYDVTNENLKVLRCGNPTCTAGNTTVSPDTTGRVGRYTSLALTSAGNPVVSYSAMPNFPPDPISRLRILFCGDPVCILGNIIRDADAGFDVGEWTSIKLDAAGRPAVAYTFDLIVRLYRCPDPTCTGTGTRVFLGPVDHASSQTSLALDALGNPVISFRHFVEGTGSSLNVIHCGDHSCLSGNTITSPDLTAGSYTSIVLDAAGNPVISYSGLRVLHCDDPNCLPPDAPVSGGKNLTIGTGAAVELAWDTGNLQTGYWIARVNITTGATDVLPAGDDPLPTGTTSYTDVSAVDGALYCYLVLPFDASGFLGLSDMQCAWPGVSTGSPVPGNFTLQLNQSDTATLNWTAPAGGVDQYVLGAVALDGSASTIIPLASGTTSHAHNTGGIPTCYILVAVQGANTGTTNVLCGWPGVSTLGEEDSSQVRAQPDPMPDLTAKVQGADLAARVAELREELRQPAP